MQTPRLTTTTASSAIFLVICWILLAGIHGGHAGTYDQSTGNTSLSLKEDQRQAFRGPHLGSIALLGAVTLGAFGLLYPIVSGLPAISERTLFSKGLSGMSELLMTRVDKGLEKFPTIPSLDPQECMKRSVCEAHNQPNKFGLVGLALQLLYPPYSAPDEPTTVVSKYQLAARYGRQEDADCSRQYDGCIISPLDILQTIVSYFLR
ncbi:uncharacterized protein LOC135398123 isoform X2 [Ornithodoros turicata]